MEKRISIPNKQETIEAYVDLQHQTHGIIIMHPHSLMGGNMDNPVVQKAQQIFARKGITTLRFNFRGVGNSTGCFGEGIGEQDDLIAVMDYLNSQGRNRLDLAGYSFGSWVMAHAVQKINDPHGIIMISPPVAFMDFSNIQKIPGLKHVITGSQDEFAPPNLIQSQLPHWQPDAQLHIIDGADHFFSGDLPTLEKILANCV